MLKVCVFCVFVLQNKKRRDWTGDSAKALDMYMCFVYFDTMANTEYLQGLELKDG